MDEERRSLNVARNSTASPFLSADEESSRSSRRSSIFKSKSRPTITNQNDESKKHQQKLKAIRDERRALLDGRYMFLFSKIAAAMDIDSLIVEDQILIDEQFKCIEEFFTTFGSKTLIFFYQESDDPYAPNSQNSNFEKKLFVSDGSSEHLVGMCYFFLRFSNRKNTTIDSIANDINFMYLSGVDGSILNTIEDLLALVFNGCLKSMEKLANESTDEATLQIIGANFFEDMNKCITSLHNTRLSLYTHVLLPQADICQNLDRMKTANDYIAASRNEATIKEMEDLIPLWCDTIELILVQNEQIRREDDDVGPSAELVYWKNRMATFNILLEQLKSTRCKALIGTLHIIKSKAIIRWRKLDGRITDASNEAKDNVKFLSTLERNFHLLSKSDPETMSESVISLMNSVKAIYLISTYYNTPQRMSALIVKVTNQMIATCKKYVNKNVVKIWDLKDSELRKRINFCQRLNDVYQQQYHKIKEEIDKWPDAVPLELSESYIFGKFDSFCKQLDKILDILNTVEENAGLENVKMEGTEKICENFKALVENIRKKNVDCLDFRKPDFDSDYEEFKTQVEMLKKLQEKFVKNSFNKNFKLIQSVVMLDKLENMHPLKFDLDSKYKSVMNTYLQQLEQIAEDYEKKKSVYLPRNVCPLVGKIIWCRCMINRIDVPMQLFRKKVFLFKTEEGKAASKLYTRIAYALFQYEYQRGEEWYKSAFQRLMGLKVPVLYRDPSTCKFHLNFDPRIHDVMREAELMLKNGAKVSQEVMQVLYCKNSICSHKSSISKLLKDFEDLREEIPNCLKEVFGPHLMRVEKSLMPGTNCLSWTSLMLDKYIMDSKKEMEEVKQLCERATDVLHSRIENIFDDISDTHLFGIGQLIPLTLDQFIKHVEADCEQQSLVLSKHTSAVERSVIHLLDIIRKPLTTEELKTSSVDVAMDPYNHLVLHFHNKNNEAFIKCIKHSLETLREYIQHEEGSSSSSQHKQLFKVDLTLVLPEVIVVPSIDEVQSCVTKSVQVMIMMLETIPRWNIVSDLEGVNTSIDVNPQFQSLLDQPENESSSSSLPKNKLLSQSVAEQKDIVRLMTYFSTSVLGLKYELKQLLNAFKVYEEMWTTVSFYSLKRSHTFAFNEMRNCLNFS